MATLAPFDVQDIENADAEAATMDALRKVMHRQLRFEAAKSFGAALLSDPSSALASDAEVLERAVRLADGLLERLEK